MAISVVAGFLVGSPATINWVALVGTVIGTALTAGGAGALNHYLEREIDSTMKRTAGRPIPGGRVAPRTAFRFGVLLCAVGIGLLCPLTNWLTASLAILTVGLYLAAYTPLKRVTVHNTLVGTIPGALPALGGYTAAVGTVALPVALPGWIVFAILVFWQLPHFYSLAWMYRKDYDRGGFAMISVDDETGNRTARAALFSCVALVLSTFALAYVQDAGVVYYLTLLVLNAWLMRFAIRFMAERTVLSARALLKASVRYIPLLVIAIVIQRLVS